MRVHGMSMKGVQSVDTGQSSKNSVIRRGKSRQIIIQDDCNEPHESFWCDATNCDDCILRFQCFTSRSDTIIITFPLETIDDKIKEINTQKWRLRDGSSRFRENR